MTVAVGQPIIAEGLLHLVERHPWLVFDHYVRTMPGLRKLMEATVPDLLVIDLNFSGNGGLELIQELSEHPSSPQILVFSHHEESVHAARVLEAGGGGYLMHNRSREEILEALETVANGRQYLSVAMRLILETTSRPNGKPHPKPATGIRQLSTRELSIFNLLGERRTTGDIALTLGISSKTVETYYERLKTKLKQPGLRDLCHFAEEWKRSVG